MELGAVGPGGRHEQLLRRGAVPPRRGAEDKASLGHVLASLRQPLRAPAVPRRALRPRHHRHRRGGHVSPPLLRPSMQEEAGEDGDGDGRAKNVAGRGRGAGEADEEAVGWRQERLRRRQKV